MRAYCLSFHADYRCRHSGACCHADWPIPLEATRLAELRMRGLSTPEAALHHETSPDGMLLTIAGRTPTGACTFYDSDDRRCAIHRDAGPELMPAACRHFPRVVLRDARGMFVTLSHYCPTAARLLLDASDISIVDAPQYVSLDGTAEGLDATAVMPPLLRRGMLMDVEGYAGWEREGLAVFNEPTYSPRAALAILAAATTDASGWQPGRDSLAAHVRAAFDRAQATASPSAHPERALFDRAVKAFLAAHLFASWSAYQGGGLAAVVESVGSALTTLESEIDGSASREAFVAAVRATDFRLRHQRS